MCKSPCLLLKVLHALLSLCLSCVSHHPNLWFVISFLVFIVTILPRWHLYAPRGWTAHATVPYNCLDCGLGAKEPVSPPDSQQGWKQGRWGNRSMWVHGLSVSVPVLVCSACRKNQCDIERAGLRYLCGSYKNLCKLNLWHSFLSPERKM